jgi:hypothetical protein
LAASRNGKIYVAGQELVTGHGLRVYRINTNGSLDSSFTSQEFTTVQLGNTPPNGQAPQFLRKYITQILFDSNGKLYVVGLFTKYGANPAKCIIRLNTDGTHDTVFDSSTGVRIVYQSQSASNPQWDGTYDGFIETALVMPDNNILISGSFSSYKGVNTSFSTLSGTPDGSIVISPTAALVQNTSPIPRSQTLVLDFPDAIFSCEYPFPNQETGVRRFTYSSGIFTQDLFWGLATRDSAIYATDQGRLTSATKLPDGKLIVNSSYLPNKYRYSGKLSPGQQNNFFTEETASEAGSLRLGPSVSISGSKDRYFQFLSNLDQTYAGIILGQNGQVPFMIGRFSYDGVFEKTLVPMSNSPNIGGGLPPDGYPAQILGPDKKLYSVFFAPRVGGQAIGVNNILARVNAIFAGTPGITTNPTANAYLTQSFSLAVTSIPEAASYGASGLPPGLAIDTATGVISGVPTDSGIYTVSLTATNDLGTGTKGLIINVVLGVPTEVNSYRALRKLATEWREFSTTVRGDILLVPQSVEIKFPWGESGVTYDMSPWGEANVSVPVLPNPPSGFKYKYYIGARVLPPAHPVIEL